MKLRRILDGALLLWGFVQAIRDNVRGSNEPATRVDELDVGGITARAVEAERARARERWPDEPSLRRPTTILPPTPAIEVAVPTTRPPGGPDEHATDDDFGNALPTTGDTGDFPIAEDLDDDDTQH